MRTDRGKIMTHQRRRTRAAASFRDKAFEEFKKAKRELGDSHTKTVILFNNYKMWRTSALAGVTT
jgi:hypothetical protein